MLALGAGLALLAVTLRQHRQLATLATRLSDATRSDPLTGLLNRRAFEELLVSELQRSRRTGRPMALIVGDLDGLGPVNARSGHRAGDAVLQVVARDMQKWKRRIDSAGRIGGEEFALLLPQTELAAAQPLVERLRAQIEAIHLSNSGDTLTASFGITARREDDRSVDELLLRADEALYVAKRRGRNCVVIR